MDKLTKGYGYYKLGLYPIGGDFHRAIEDMPIEKVIQDLRSMPGYPGNCHGCTHVVLFSNGTEAAINWQYVNRED